MRRLLLAACCLLLAVPAQATRLFTSGFESNDLGATVCWTGNNGVVIETTPAPHSGTYSAESFATGGNRQVQCNLQTNKTSGTLFFRFYFYVNTVPNVDESEVVFVRSSTGTRAYDVYIDITGGEFVCIKNRVPATPTTACGSTDIATATWYRVEVRHLLGDGTVGELQLRLFSGDSTTTLDDVSLTAQDTLPTNIKEFFIGNLLGVTYSYNYDDVAINDDGGTFQNSWPGPGKIALVKPASDDTVAWTRQGAGCTGVSNAACVDDVPGTPDDATTYNDNATSGNTDRLNKTGLPAEVPSDADIVLVDVYARFGGSGTSGVRQCSVELWDEVGTQTSGPTTTLCDTAAWSLMGTDDHLVFDAGSRTKANLDDADFDLGYANRSSHSNRVSAVWANVEWKEAAAAGPSVMPSRSVVWE